MGISIIGYVQAMGSNNLAIYSLSSHFRAGFALSAVLSALLLSGCGDSSKKSPFVAHEFDLGEKQFSIKLPIKASVQASIDKNLVMMHLQPKEKFSPRITLRMPFTDDLVLRSGQVRKLGGGGRLNYRISTSAVSSSGAREAFLNGHLVLGGMKYVVSCSIQSKFVTIDHAAWCVEYLKTLHSR